MRALIKGGALAVLVVGGAGLLKLRLRGPRFLVYPQAEVAEVKNPHAYLGKPLCQACHPDADERLMGDALAVCARCHPFDGHRSHVVGVVQRTPPPEKVELPLGEGGIIVCHTCHDPHVDMRAAHGLRGPEDSNRLCLQCHLMH